MHLTHCMETVSTPVQENPFFILSHHSDRHEKHSSCPTAWTESFISDTIKIHEKVKMGSLQSQTTIGAKKRTMPPKTSDGKPPKKKPSTTKRTTTEGKTAKKTGNKPVASTATRPARPQAKEPQASYPDSSMALSEELRKRIAQRAYEIHHQRGGQHGSDWEDWLQAEREILLQQPPPL